MSFGNFLRRISFDSEKIHTDSPTSSEGNETSGMNAFFTSPSKIFESVNAKTGHLVSDLNQKLDISGKLDSIKQASVGTLEQVVRGSSSVVVNRSDSKDVPQREEIIAGENAVKPSDIDSPSFYNKSKADFDVAHSTKSTSQFSPAHQSQTSSSTAAGGGSSSSGLRRQSTQNTPRPPRPPPPSSAALSRAMSLDENNLSAQMKTIRKGQPTDEQSDDSHRMKYSGKDRLLSSKAIEESCILQQPDALVIEEEENSSASEYGENGDQPIYRPESELPIPADKQTSISISHAKSPASSSKSAAVRDEEQKETSSSAYRLTSTEPSGTNIEEIQEFMELYASALIIGRSDYIKNKEIELQELLTTPAGRIGFVNALEQESRRTQGLVDLQALPKLLDQIGLLLVECQNAEDFSPAKKLLTISLQFYTYDPSVSTDRTFIFAYIKNQPIWQSLRFWNACFFQSLQEARSKAEESPYDARKSASTTYDQLKSYLHTMNVFNLHETIKQEFLRKQADLFNLNDDEISSLLSIISSSD